MSDYKNMTPEKVEEYIRTQTDLFPSDADLDVHEFGVTNDENEGDGFVNFIYRITDKNTGASVILKQARDYAKRIGKGDGHMVYDVRRNGIEADILRIKHAITPEYIPEMYHIDRENHLYIYEDAKDLKILRFMMDEGHIYKKMPVMLGEFVAKNNFYTSELYLEPEMHQKLEAHFENPEMRHLFQILLFNNTEWPMGDAHEDPDVDPVRMKIGDSAWNDHELQTEMLKLRHIYMAKSECLIHSDLHTSNILLDDDHMKIIDMEYAFVGCCSSDSGYLLGNFVYQFVRWFYVKNDNAKALSAAALYYIQMFLETYRAVFKACYDEDARDMYRGFDDYCDYLIDVYFHETVGFIGSQVMSRVGRCTTLPDIDTIPDENDRRKATYVLLNIGKYLVKHRNDIKDPEDLVNTISRLGFHLVRSLKGIDMAALSEVE